MPSRYSRDAGDTRGADNRRHSPARRGGAVRPHGPHWHLTPPSDAFQSFPLEASMARWIKSILYTLLVMFIIYYIYTRPEAAADFVRGVFGIFDSIGRFFEGLVR